MIVNSIPPTTPFPSYSKKPNRIVRQKISRKVNPNFIAALYSLSLTKIKVDTITAISRIDRIEIISID
jgi:hypothetical protein